MNRLTVCYLTNSSAPYGANKALLSMIDGISKIEKNIQFAAIVIEEGFLTQELEKRNIKLFNIKHKFDIKPGRKTIKDLILFPVKILRDWIINEFAVIKISRWLDSNFNQDELIIHSNTGPTFVGYKVARRLDVNHVWHLREYQDLDFNMEIIPSKKIFINRLNKKRNYPIAITEGVKSHFRKLKKIQVIYDGVIDEEITPENCFKINQILFLGRIEKTKGIEELLKGLVLLKKDDFFISNNFKLRVVGGGDSSYIEELKSFCAEKKISELIKWDGFIADPQKLISQSKVTIVPSMFEGFGFVTVESLYQGTLVVGRNSGGTKEILETLDLDQFLFESNMDMKEKILEILKMTEEDYNQLALKGYKGVRQNYSYTKNAKTVLRFYKNIINV